MTAVTILAGAKVSQRRVARRLLRAGYTLTTGDDSVLVSAETAPDAVTMSVQPLAEVPAGSAEAAGLLLGVAPRAALTCSFTGPPGRADSWPTVVGIARAVAAEVPLAVLDDSAGTRYLVDAKRGLIAPAEYEQVRGRPSTGELLRRMLGT